MLRRCVPLLLFALVVGCGEDEPPPSTEAAARPAAPIVSELGPAVSVGRGDEKAHPPSGKGVPRPPKEKKGKVGVGAGAACPDIDLEPDGSNLDRIERSVLCLVNGERTDVGLATLAGQDQLTAASRAWSQQLVADQFWSHESPSGSTVGTRLADAGYTNADDWMTAENLAYGSGPRATPRAIVQSWLASTTGHRENMLEPSYRDAGVGVTLGLPVDRRTDGATVAMNFGWRKGVRPVVAGPRITPADRRRCKRLKRVPRIARGKVRCVKRNSRR